MKRARFSLALGLLAASTSMAQDRSTQEPVDMKLEVNYVLVDVFASDRQGNPVTDLNLDEFTVEDDGDPVEVRLFEAVDFSFAPPVAELRQMNERRKLAQPQTEDLTVSPQTFLLVLDFAVMDPADRKAAIEELRSFFRALKPRLNLNIFFFAIGYGPLSDRFSNSPQAALILLDEHEKEVMANTQASLMFTRFGRLDQLEWEFDRCLQHLEVKPGNVGQRAGAGNTPVELGVYYRCLSTTYDDFVNLQVKYSANVLATLESLVTEVGKLPGLKSVYYVSPGFSLRPGSTASQVARSYVDRIKTGMFRQSGSFRGTKVAPVTPHFSSRSLLREYQNLTNSASANRVIFHMFRWGGIGQSDRMHPAQGTAGLSTNTQQHYDLMWEEHSNGLRHISDQTGGSFHDGNNLSGSLNEVVNRNTFYYVLGYDMSAMAGRSKNRKIKVTCMREGVSLDYRKRYSVAPSEDFN